MAAGVKYLVDTNSKETYNLGSGPNFIVSSCTSRLPPAAATSTQRVIETTSLNEDDGYYLLEVQTDPPSVRVLEGGCSVNGETLLQDSPWCALNHGSFLVLGNGRSLQYLSSQSPHCSPGSRRRLPPTPGKALEVTPPSKPRRRNHQQYDVSSFGEVLKHDSVGDGSGGGDGDDGGLIDLGVRSRLKRIAAEVSSRHSGYEDRKPPPPYEQVGNSIGYQLLHQQQHRMVTSELIDSLYPSLKANELKDESLVRTYTTYLKVYQECRTQPASPQCLLPADLPTLDFVVDMLLHLCCMPHMTSLAEKQGVLWCQLLAFFSRSHQNQLYMAMKRHPTKILSCMHLNIMSTQLRFQEYGWTVLANTARIPTPAGQKPVLSESSFTLALSLTESQLASYFNDLQLIVAIVNFLAQVAISSKTSISNRNKEETSYSKEQGVKMLKLFHEKAVLRQVMKVPPHLRKDESFEQVYSSLVKALVPTRGKLAGEGGGGANNLVLITPLTRNNLSVTRRGMKIHRKRSSLDSIASSEVVVPEEAVDGVSSSADNSVCCPPPKPVCSTSCSDLLRTGRSDPDEVYQTHSSPDLMEDKNNVGSFSQSRVTTLPSPSSSETAAPPSPPATTTPPSPPATTTPPSPPATTSPPSPPSTTTPPSPPATTTPPSPPATTSPPSPPSTTSPPSPPATTSPPSPPATTSPPSPPAPVLSPPSPPVNTTPPSPPATTSPPSPPAPVLSPPSPPATTTPPSPPATTSPPSPPATTSPPSPPAPVLSPPMTPNTAVLAEDVQSLIDTLHSPLDPVSCKVIRVPSLRRYNHYYRHSFKRTSFKKTNMNYEQTNKSLDSTAMGSSSPDSGKLRPLWGQVTPYPSMSTQNNLFEVSGEYLSSSYSAVEEVTSGHTDIELSLQTRIKLLDAVLLMWSKGKGLQAATNLLQGCFSEDINDVVLFMDALRCFHQYQSSWTLAVAFVLLPALHQLVTSTTQKNCIEVVCTVILMVVERFSDLILTCKVSKRKNRLSSSMDREQLLVCYKELHSIREVLTHRLDLHQDPLEVGNMLRQLHAKLKPFKQEI